jgi:hypothetical protein
MVKQLIYGCQGYFKRLDLGHELVDNLSMPVSTG